MISEDLSLPETTPAWIWEALIPIMSKEGMAFAAQSQKDAWLLMLLHKYSPQPMPDDSEGPSPPKL
jgi:hypothetical protein